MDFFCDPCTNTAFFRIHVPVGLKALRDKSPCFLLIHPERILSLVLQQHGIGGDEDDDDDDDDRGGGDAAQETNKATLQAVRKRLYLQGTGNYTGSGDHISSLQFELSTPGDLVVAALPSLVPRNKVFGDVLDSMKLLARHTTLFVYLAGGDVLHEKLRLICQAFRGCHPIKSMPRYADLTNLYKGKGGRLLEGAGAAGHLAAEEATSPPSYDELALSPPRPSLSGKSGTQAGLEMDGRRFEAAASPSKCFLLPKDRPWLIMSTATLTSGPDSHSRSQSSSRKRARVDSTSHSQYDPPPALPAELTKLLVETICERVTEAVLTRWQARQGDTDSRLRRVEHGIERLERRIDSLAAAGQEQHSEVVAEIQNARDDVDKLVDVRLDDRMTGAKLELDEYISDVVDDKIQQQQGYSSPRDSLQDTLEEYIDRQVSEVGDRVEERVLETMRNASISFNIT